MVVFCMRLLNPDVIKREVSRPLVLATFFFSPVVVVCMILLNPDVCDEKRSSSSPACRLKPFDLFFTGLCCLHETAQINPNTMKRREVAYRPLV